MLSADGFTKKCSGFAFVMFASRIKRWKNHRKYEQGLSKLRICF